MLLTTLGTTLAKRQNPGHNYRLPAAVSSSYETASIRGLLPGAESQLRVN